MYVRFFVNGHRSKYIKLRTYPHNEKKSTVSDKVSHLWLLNDSGKKHAETITQKAMDRKQALLTTCNGSITRDMLDYFVRLFNLWLGISR